MAKINVLNRSEDYLTVRVTLGDGRAYDQTIVSLLRGEALDEMLAAYAEDYAAGIAALDALQGEVA